MSSNSYNSFSKFLHWSMALIVIGMLGFGFFMDDMAKSLKPTVYMLHKSFGLLILAMFFIRLIWNLTKGVPALPNSLSDKEKKMAKYGHHALYLMLLIMPLSGLLMSIAANRLPSFFNLFTVTIPGVPQSKSLAGFMNQSHEVLAWVFIGLVVLHIASALIHKIVKKDGVFERMAGG